MLILSDLTVLLNFLSRPVRGNGAASANPSRPGTGSCEELYTVEVTEAAVRRSNSGGCVLEGGRGSQRNSRSNSRQEFHSGSETGGVSGSASSGNYPACNTCRGPPVVGRASSRQSDRQSDGGYRSDGMMGGRGSAGSGSGVCGSRTGIDGYRSEGSTDSPMRHNQSTPASGANGSGRKPHHRQMQPMPNAQSFHQQPLGSGMPPPLPPHHGPAHLKQRNGQLELVSQPSTSQQQQQQQQQQLQQCSTSRSMHSFQRQESSASFQSGHSMRSTHSAPTCPNHNIVGRHHHHHHPQQQQPQQPQPPQQQQQQYRHMGYPSQANVESCSTQSSSSSASAPPDYATCSGIPPSYDQATYGNESGDLTHHHRRKPQREQTNHQRGHSASRQARPVSATGAKRVPPPGTQALSAASYSQPPKPQDVRSNDFYYVGEFYG